MYIFKWGMKVDKLNYPRGGVLYLKKKKMHLNAINIPTYIVVSRTPIKLCKHSRILKQMSLKRRHLESKNAITS